MTYVSRGEKIFALPDRTYPNCSPPCVKRSDGRLKRFESLLDFSAWATCPYPRYKYLYNLMSGSQTCLTSRSCFQYVPLEALIDILLAEKDAYIKCLQKQISGAPKVEVDELFRARQFNDDDDKLELQADTRDMLRKAMHKLENIDDIVNENKCLKERLRCSEELVKYLEEKKGKLEKEVENLRSKTQIQRDLENAQEELSQMMHQEQAAEGQELNKLAQERDVLQKKVEELQRELDDAKSKQSELDLLKKKSASDTMNLEEITRENECFKKKLSSMKCLEKQIEGLKKQASLLANKYKKDGAKCECQNKRLNDACKELGSLRQERDKLKKRVDELACIEAQYYALQCKLEQVDAIIAENEMLNCKLASLDKLELENELLRCKLEQCHASEMEAAESKEKILELQSAVADQEEEMKDLLCQIERLTRAYGKDNELDRLKEELCEKDTKLKLCEEQLAEIPLLEAEIDDLRSKLEKCYSNIGGRGPGRGSAMEKTDVTVFGNQYQVDVEFKQQAAMCQDVKQNVAVLEKIDTSGEKCSMTCEEVQNLLQSSKGIINCVLEDMVEHQKEMEELEKCNREMKEEIKLLKCKMGKTDMDDCLQRIAELQSVIQEKEKTICCLQKKLTDGGGSGKVNDHVSNLQSEIDYLKQLNGKMRKDLEDACAEIKRCAEMECMLEEEKRARICAENAAKRASESSPWKSEEFSKMKKEEYNLEAKESSLMCEVEELRNQVDDMKCLLDELKRENALLRESQTPCSEYMKELDEKHALENLLNILQCELDSCRQQAAANDCEALTKELKRLREQNCQLKNLINCYKERLDLERRSKKPGSGDTKRTDCLEEENRKLRSEIVHLRCDLAEICKELETWQKKFCDQQDELDMLRNSMASVKEENQLLQEGLDEKDTESQKLKGDVSKLLDHAYKLSSDIDVLKDRLKEAEEGQEGIPETDMEQDLSEKHAIETAMRGVEQQVDNLESKLEEVGKADMEKEELLLKQAAMEDELDRLRKLLAECEKHRDTVSEKPSAGPPVEAPPPSPVAVPPVVPSGVPPVTAAPPFVPPDTAVPPPAAVAPPVPAAPPAAAAPPVPLTPPAAVPPPVPLATPAAVPPPSVPPAPPAAVPPPPLPPPLPPPPPPPPPPVTPAPPVAVPPQPAPPAPPAAVPPPPPVPSVPLTVPPIPMPPAGVPPLPPPVMGPSQNEEKLLEEMVGMRERMSQLQSEVDAANAEKKRLQSEIDELMRLLAECNKEKGHQESQVALMSSEYQATAYSAPTEPRQVPQTLIPIKEEQRPTILERGVRDTVIPPEPPSKPVAARSITIPELPRVVTEKPKPEIERPMSRKSKTDDSKLVVPARGPSVSGRRPSASGKGRAVPPCPSEESSIIDFAELDPDFSKFLCSLNPADHKRNICLIEKRYKEKMCDLKKNYDEKVKALMGHFEKESQVRDRIFNDSVISMKSGYEMDIRKLVERHKASIMRLQSLHEDEVQELNTNYEIQMEAMQTQNNNVVNDLSAGAMEKFKLLTQKHKEDLKDVERKYHQLLESKESKHRAEMSQLRTSMTQNISAVEQYHTKRMSDMSEALQGNIADIQTDHNRELRKLKKSNLKRIDMIKHKYEDLLMCERKKYEKELEDKIQRLKQGKQLTDGICQCRFMPPCSPKDPNAPLDFNDILRKILSEGLESLSFNEIALVHKKTCAATEGLILDPNLKAQLSPTLAHDACSRSELLKANKEELLNRILVLENEIAAKQSETQDAIINMELAVKAERKRLQELRDSLRLEQDKNSELKLALSQTVATATVTTRKAPIDVICCPQPPVRECDILEKIKEMQNAKVIFAPEKDISKYKIKKPSSRESKREKSNEDECKSRHKASAKKKHKK